MVTYNPSKLNSNNVMPAINPAVIIFFMVLVFVINNGIAKVKTYQRLSDDDKHHDV